MVSLIAISVRNLDDHVQERLRIRAAHHSRSMEAEIRAILAAAVREQDDANGLVQTMPNRFARSAESSSTYRRERPPSASSRPLLMIIIDTSVASEIMKPFPAPAVRDWVHAHHGTEFDPWRAA